jgi:hypothetical protein
VRGDSLRDLYAKTLAVIGLALLAGAGAIVDYWPVPAPVPRVDSPRLPAPSSPSLAQRLDQRIPAPKMQAPVVVRGTIHAKNVGSARFLTATPAVVAQMSLPPAPIPVPQASWALMDTESMSQLMAQTPELIAVAWQAAPTTTPAATDQPGFIGGALRKTKDSIVKTGAVTGATIADAVRGVGRAFKKVSPW